MFSDIQNIRSASEPLKTEAVDSRLNNRKNRDEDNRGSKHPENDRSEKTESGALLTSNGADKESVNRFSLDSLIYFLEDFLEENMALPAEQEEPDITSLDVSTISPCLRSKHANSNPHKAPSLSSDNADMRRNAIPPRYAAHAYAHRALSNSISTSIRRRTKLPSASGGEAGSLLNSRSIEQSAKINDIYSLIRDLRAMKERGSTHLDVKDDAALLDGIGAAIRKNTLA